MAFCKYILLSSLVCFATTVFGLGEFVNTDSTGLPGDNFNLEGTLDLFKNTTSLERFEEKLNTPDNHFNNLDLNDDGEVDYIKVIDYMDGNTHAIVLQTPISETEAQDIAVITIEKNGDQSAVIQIVGDEDLYGRERIVEPTETNSKTSNTPGNNSTSQIVIVNAWGWPSVRYIYAPGYVVYKSAWRWRYYPAYYRPWKPYPLKWHYYHARAYKVKYHITSSQRVVRAPLMYKPVRNTSIVVKNKYYDNKVNKTVIRNNKQVSIKRNNPIKGNGKVIRSKNTKTLVGNRGNRRGRRN